MLNNENRPSLKYSDYGQYIGSMVQQEPVRAKQARIVLHEPEPDQLYRLDGDGLVDRRFNPNREPVNHFDEEAKARAESEGMVAKSVQRRLAPNKPVTVRP